jgi:hypothetical protein
MGCGNRRSVLIGPCRRIGRKEIGLEAVVDGIHRIKGSQVDIGPTKRLRPRKLP